MLCVHEAIKGPAKLVTIVKPDEIVSPSDVSAVHCFVITTVTIRMMRQDQKYITAESFSNPTPTKRSSKADHGAR